MRPFQYFTRSILFVDGYDIANGHVLDEQWHSSDLIAVTDFINVNPFYVGRWPTRIILINDKSYLIHCQTVGIKCELLVLILVTRRAQYDRVTILATSLINRWIVMNLRLI